MAVHFFTAPFCMGKSGNAVFLHPSEERGEALFISLQTDQIVVRMAFSISQGNVDASGNHTVPTDEVAGTEAGIIGVGCQFYEGTVLHQKQKIGAGCFFFDHIHPETDTGPEKDGKPVQIG